MSRRLVVEADGGARGNPGPAAYGAVVRDAESGEVLAERWEAIGHATNNVAEYRGLIAALEAAMEVDPEAHVEARLDSKLIVEQMSGRWKIKDATLRGLAIRARDLLPPGRVSYVWVPREQNHHADALVNRALDGEGQPSLPAEVAAPPRALPGWSPDMGRPTVTLLGRHGATAMTLERRFSGAGGEDPPLAPIGREQAQALGAEIARRGGVDRVVCSPLLRARETAEIVAAAARVDPPEVVDDLAECSFGEWDGLTFAEVRERWPDEMTAWLSSTAVAPPGGESFESHRDRVDRARLHLIGEHRGERIAVIAHVTPIKMMVGIALDVPVHTLYRMELLPCSLTTIGWWSDGNASMRGFAESGHLDGLVDRGV